MDAKIVAVWKPIAAVVFLVSAAVGALAVLPEAIYSWNTYIGPALRHVSWRADLAACRNAAVDWVGAEAIALVHWGIALAVGCALMILVPMLVGIARNSYHREYTDTRNLIVGLASATLVTVWFFGPAWELQTVMPDPRFHTLRIVVVVIWALLVPILLFQMLSTFLSKYDWSI